MKPKPKRGEVWMVDLGLAAKIRPACVISVDLEEEDRALVGIVPHTTQLRETRFEAVVRVPWLKPGAFDAQGIRPVPPSVFRRRLGTLNATGMTEVESAVLRWTGIANPSEP